MSEDAANEIVTQVTANGEKPVDGKKPLLDSVQTFGAIGLLEAVQGEVVLRGRAGERDHLFPLERAVEKYFSTMALVRRYALYGVRGWDTLAEIAEDLKHKILEAADQRKKENRPVPKAVLELEQSCPDHPADAGKESGQQA